jgi:hypothetical protein
MNKVALLAFMNGYMAKQAAIDMPDPSYTKILPGFGSKLDAGRARALVEATGEEPSFLLKYPGLATWASGLSGGAAGAAIGGVLTSGEGQRQKQFGIQAGAVGGTLLGMIVNSLARVKATKDAVESVDSKDIDKKIVQRKLEEEADRSRVGGVIKDMATATGSNNLGYTQQMLNLKDNKNRIDYPAAEITDGVTSVVGLPLKPLMQALMGYEAMRKAEKGV